MCTNAIAATFLKLLCWSRIFGILYFRLLELVAILPLAERGQLQKVRPIFAKIYILEELNILNQPSQVAQHTFRKSRRRSLKCIQEHHGQDIFSTRQFWTQYFSREVFFADQDIASLRIGVAPELTIVNHLK